MKVVVAGANGQVGRELCFLLRTEGHEVWPVVRNRWAAAFLRDRGFACRVEELTEPDDARRAVADADVVVLAAYARATAADANAARRANPRINEHAVRFAAPGAVVVHLSSIRRFSHRVDRSTPRFGPHPVYDRDKRRDERTFQASCARHGRARYVLRLGHVVGWTQDKTRKFRGLVRGVGGVTLGVDPDQVSNVVHTVTIMDAVLRCAGGTVRPGAYTLVNRPQWTWREVFEHYRDPALSVTFRPPGGDGTPGRERWLAAVVGAARRYRQYLAPLRRVMPEGMRGSYLRRAHVQVIEAEIARLGLGERAVRLAEFGYRPVPGPFLESLTETRALLARYPRLAQEFEGLGA